MLTAKLKNLLNGGASKAGVEGLQIEINGLETEAQAIRAELAQIPGRRAEFTMFAEDDAKLDELERHEAKLYRGLERLDLQIAALTGRMVEQRNLQRKHRIEFHQRALRAMAEKLDDAVTNAIAANEAAVAAFEAATAEIGERDSIGLFPRVHFGAGLNREGLDLWHRSIAAIDASPPAQVVRIAPAQKPSNTKNGAVRLGVDNVYRPGPRSRPLRILPEVVPPGHVRVRVLRNGYESPTGEQLASGDDVDLPSLDATKAACNGAVELPKT